MAKSKYMKKRAKKKTKPKKELTIKEAQQVVDKWIKQYGVKYFSELSILAQLTEEMGELARVISREYGDQCAKKEEKLALPDELADVFFALICLANKTGVDINEALQKNLEKKTKRDAKRQENNPKLNKK